MFPTSQEHLAMPEDICSLVVTPGLGVGWVRTVFLASGGERQEAAKHPTMCREASSHPSEGGSCSNSSTVTGTDTEKPCFRLSAIYPGLHRFTPRFGLGEGECAPPSRPSSLFNTHHSCWLTFHLSCKSVHKHSTKCLLDIRR